MKQSEPVGRDEMNPDDLSRLPGFELLKEYAVLTRAGFDDPNPIGHSDGYLAKVRRRAAVQCELLVRLGKDPRP